MWANVSDRSGTNKNGVLNIPEQRDHTKHNFVCGKVRKAYFIMPELVIGACHECGAGVFSLQARCDYENNGCREPSAVCEDCDDGMFTSTFRAGHYHRKCLPFEWTLYDAFDRFGFTGGESRRNYTYLVKEAIEAIGYTVEDSEWGHDNSNCIKRITRISDGKGVYGEYCEDGECHDRIEPCEDQTCPHHRWLGGFLNGRTFANTLPDDICDTLSDLQTVTERITGFVSCDGPSIVTGKTPFLVREMYRC
jgi:hypothetical protein